MTATATLIRATAVAVAIAAGAGCKSSAPQPPPAATPPALSAPMHLFNGHDTSGWVQVLDSKWTVEDGVLLARQDPKGRRDGESWLVTEKDFTDFLLAVKFRVTPGGNSGVFLRDPIPRATRLAAPDGGEHRRERGGANRKGGHDTLLTVGRRSSRRSPSSDRRATS